MKLLTVLGQIADENMSRVVSFPAPRVQYDEPNLAKVSWDITELLWP